ncbi:MAG TPA: Tim44-like domain-containing protein [Usitatibacteraceae bacterium]|nr:Tim44-like domain-containing protein [Usitatibacteraceae bacterium]
MNKLLITVTLVAATLYALDVDAQSRRLGGGRTAGKQSQNVQRQATPPAAPDAAKAPAAPAATAATPAAAAPTAAIPPKPASPWKGLMGGALLGLGLGALFSSMGMGSAMAGVLSTLLTFALIGGVIYLVYRFFFRKPAGTSAPGNLEPSYAGASGSAGGFGGTGSTSGSSSSMPFKVPEIGSGIAPRAAAAEPVAAATAATAAGPFGVTPDFDVPAFLRSAKTYFIRLQAAWDKGDSADLREFTTPEMFGELKLQLQERGAAPNLTDVVTLDAELLGLEIVGEDHLASVKFTGTIKDSPAASAEPFTEVWNISKRVKDKDGWQLAGIQQLS